MFASKKQKMEKDYRYLADILKSSNMDTEEKVLSHLKKVSSRAIKATILVALVIGSLCLLWEKYIPIWGITGIMCFAWIWRSALEARKIMHRYIDEEIHNKKEVTMENDETKIDDVEKTDDIEEPSKKE